MGILHIDATGRPQTSTYCVYRTAGETSSAISTHIIRAQGHCDTVSTVPLASALNHKIPSESAGVVAPGGGKERWRCPFPQNHLLHKPSTSAMPITAAPFRLRQPPAVPGQQRRRSRHERGRARAVLLSSQPRASELGLWRFFADGVEIHPTPRTAPAARSMCIRTAYEASQGSRLDGCQHKDSVRATD